jgi:hypothetical protein
MPSDLPRELTDAEPIVRFVFHKSDVVPSKNTVRWRVFLPDKNRTETSVSRVQDLQDDDVWPLGDLVAKLSGQNPPIAGGQLNVEHVRRHKLEVVSSEPPPRHAAIVHWPAEKDRQMSYAQLLRQHVVLRRR